MRRFLYVMVALLVLALVAEFTLTVLAQRGMKKSLSRRYGLPPDIDVAIGAFPFIISLARKHLGELRLSWDGECLLSHRGRESAVAYRCVVYLYDVEIDAASLMRGDMKLHSATRVEAYIELPMREVAAFLGIGDVASTEEGRLASAGVEDGEHPYELHYAVRVVGEDAIAFFDIGGKEGFAEDGAVSEGELDTEEMRVSIHGLPLKTKTKSASLEGEKLVVEISISEWEGYLNASTGTEDFMHICELDIETKVIF